MKLKTLTYDCSKKEAIEFIESKRRGKDLGIRKNSFDTKIEWFDKYSDGTKDLIATWIETDKAMGNIEIPIKYAPRKYHDSI